MEDVYLFHGVARDNPKDHRLFALAEVRDMTVVPDSRGGQPGLPDARADGPAGDHRHAPRPRDLPGAGTPAGQPDHAVRAPALDRAQGALVGPGRAHDPARRRRRPGAGRPAHPDAPARRDPDAHGVQRRRDHHRGHHGHRGARPRRHRAPAHALPAEGAHRPALRRALPVRDPADVRPAAGDGRQVPARALRRARPRRVRRGPGPGRAGAGPQQLEPRRRAAHHLHRGLPRGHDPGDHAVRPDPRPGQPRRAGVPDRQRGPGPGRAAWACPSSGSRSPPAR